MPIPDFEADGLLPEGRHPATAAEVMATLVTAFEDSATRAALFGWWQAYRAAIDDIIPIRASWLAGSFTTDKRDPADIDVVTVLDGREYDELPRHRRLLVSSLIGGTRTEQFWRCDAHPVVCYPEDDLGFSRSKLAEQRWHSYYSHTRDGEPQGYLEVTS